MPGGTGPYFPPFQPILSVAPTWKAPGALFVGGDFDLYRTNDCGMVWSRIPVKFSVGANVLRFVATDQTGGLFAVQMSAAGTSYFNWSPDDGKTWIGPGGHSRSVGQFAYFGKTYTLSVSTGASPVAYVYAVPGRNLALPTLWRLNPGAELWEDLGIQNPGIAAVDPVDGTIVYGGLGGPYLRRSVDGARTFEPYTRSLCPEPTIPTGGLVSVSIEPDRSLFWMSVHAAGLYQSRDLGVTWQQIADPPDGERLSQIAIDPFDHDAIYAVTVEGNLWRYRWDGKIAECT
ncbi:MAG: hypothetical protein U0821_23650 [Chloroflexota bacterium]